ncbi:MAG: Uma2 family endonuclease [Planctomycetaceae bacterium]
MSTILDTTTLVLGPEHNGMRMTPEEFDAVTEYDEDYRYELIKGVVVVNAIPAEQERDPNEELGYRLRRYRDDHPQGRSLDATLTEQYIFLSDSRRRADRVIWCGLGRTPDPRRDVPNVAAEFVSEGRRSWLRDYVEKRVEYLTAGIEEYWLFDRFQRILTVYRKTADGWQEQTVKENETYRPALLPGFELRPGDLFALADRWGPQ